MPSTPPSLWTDRPDDWDAAPEPAGADAAEPVRSSRPPRPRRSRVKLAAGVAALALASGGAYALGTDHAGGGETTLAAAPAMTLNATPKTDVGAVYAKDSAAVVSVRVGNGSGSGFVIDKQGTIVTNDHVVGNAQSAQVRFNDSDGLVNAKVIGADPSSDLAVLHVDPSALPQGLTPLTFAQSEDVAVGDSAIAIGYPLGLERTATAGIISGLGREIQAPNGYRIDSVLQTDAPINPGNSGGPLLDAQGRVMGVNSQIATAGGGSGNVGIGFAIPSDTVRQVVPKILKGETIKRPFLGVSTAPSTHGSGAEIAQVSDASPAARAGLQAGDLITRIDGKQIAGPQDVLDAVANHAPGDAITVSVSRGGQTVSRKLDLAVRPQSSP